MPNGNGSNGKRPRNASPSKPTATDLTPAQRSAAELLAQIQPRLTQGEVAKRVGVSRWSVVQWFHNSAFSEEVERLRLENCRREMANFAPRAWAELMRIIADPEASYRDKIAAVRVGFEDLRNAGSVAVITNVTQNATTVALENKSPEELERILDERRTKLTELREELLASRSVPERN